MTPPPRSSPRMVVATDFSDPARAAFREALKLAKLMSASIEVVHVQTPRAPVAKTGPVPTTAEQEAFEDRVDALLIELSDESLRAGIACVTTSLTGDAHAQILNHAARTGADMIVAGTHGRTGLSHIVMGSVAEGLVRHSTIPVVVIPRKPAAG